MTYNDWVCKLREEILKRLREYEEMPAMLRNQGFARFALADSIAEFAAENAHLLILEND